MNGIEAAQQFKDLLTQAQPWRNAWQDLAEMFQPRLYHDFAHEGVSGSMSTVDKTVHSRIFDTTGHDALRTLATGMFAWTTPRSRPWSAYAAPEGVEAGEEVKAWLDAATDIARKSLRKSNFYNTIFELHQDRCCFGTSCLGRFYERGKFHFRVERDFVCSEGMDDVIDSVFVRRIYSHRQALATFGKEALPADVVKGARDPRRWNETAEYVHACYPNPDHDPESPLAKHAEFVSQWVRLSDGHEISKDGSWYNPYLVTRFLTWSGKNPAAPYGWSPAFMALPEARQLNLLEQLLDSAVDVAINPRILMPYDLETRVDFRPGGRTVIPETGHKPEEWLTGADVRIGAERAEQKRERINRAFMTDLFRMFAELDNPNMTAAEVYARMGERLDNASPAFDLYHVDVLEPLEKWRFQVLAREQRLPANIPSGMVAGNNGAETLVPEPEIEFSNRIEIEVQAAKEQASVAALERILPFAQVDPAVAEEFDLPKVAREYFRGTGGNHQLLRSNGEKRRRMMNQQQQAMMMAQMQQQQPQQMAA